MPIKILTPEQQGNGHFNGGAIMEKKPIPFYHESGGLKPYSNLFYWAYAWSENGSTIGIHPHKGFEIMSFVLKGDIEHFDTHNKKWLPLSAGDVQIIRSGSGISHSEKVNANSSIFQIWFDPDLNKSLPQPASYDDYKVEEFPVEAWSGVKVKKIIGNGSPVKMLTEGIELKEYTYAPGSFDIEPGKNRVASCFLLSGSLQVQDAEIKANDFFIISGEDKISMNVKEPSVLFVIYSPARPSYRTYLELTQQKFN